MISKICQIKPADISIRRFFLPLLILFGTHATAQQASPFLTRNQSPFSLIYGLPLASSAQLLENQQSRLISTLNLSNTVNSQTGLNDSLQIDIETWQLSLLYDYSFQQNWMIRLQLPFTMHSGGFMDGPIDAYHQALGLPEGLRPTTPDDEIEVSYSQNNVQQLLLNTDQSSFGDISLQLAWQSSLSDKGSTSYWLSLKLPSGDAKKLTGSGATDISAWVSTNYRLNNTRWLFAQGGFLYMNDSDVLGNIHKNWAGFATLGIKFQPWDNIELKTQLDMHTAFYDSEIQFLGDVVQLTFGGSYHFNSSHQLDFAVVEDINDLASPDVNFNISWWVNY